MTIPPILLIIGAFFCGSIPSGVLIGRFLYRIDPREHGSGNIGAANALRTLGSRGAAMVLLADALKGYLPTLLAILVAAERPGVEALPYLVALATILGHCFNPWLHWRGGKGVATALGALVALGWPIAIVALLGYAASFALTRISSIGSLTAIGIATIGLAGVDGHPGTLYGVTVLLLIIYTHRANLQRIQTGSEPRFSLGVQEVVEDAPNEHTV